MSDVASLCTETSILVVGYNSREHIAAALAAIPDACTKHTCEVLFVNNGSDASEELVASSFPEVRILPSIGNVGFAGGNNYLAAAARGNWLLLLNPDTRVYPGAIDSLLDAAAARPEFGVLGGVTVANDGCDLAMSSLRFPTLATIARGIWGGQPVPSALPDVGPVTPVEAVSGGFMLVARAVWDRLGGLDQAFFLYAEELDFAKRATDTGYRVGLVREARAFHDVGSGEPRSPVRLSYAMRGIAHYYHKHFSPARAWACVGLHWISNVVRFLTGLLLGWRSPHFRQLRRAFAPVSLRPWQWMRGYDSPVADPTRSKRIISYREK